MSKVIEGGDNVVMNFVSRNSKRTIYIPDNVEFRAPVIVECMGKAVGDEFEYGGFVFRIDDIIKPGEDGWRSAKSFDITRDAIDIALGRSGHV